MTIDTFNEKIVIANTVLKEYNDIIPCSKNDISIANWIELFTNLILDAECYGEISLPSNTTYNIRNVNKEIKEFLSTSKKLYINITSKIDSNDNMSEILINAMDMYNITSNICSNLEKIKIFIEAGPSTNDCFDYQAGHSVVSHIWNSIINDFIGTVVHLDDEFPGYLCHQVRPYLTHSNIQSETK